MDFGLINAGFKILFLLVKSLHDIDWFSHLADNEENFVWFSFINFFDNGKFILGRLFFFFKRDWLDDNLVGLAFWFGLLFVTSGVCSFNATYLFNGRLLLIFRFYLSVWFDLIYCDLFNAFWKKGALTFVLWRACFVWCIRRIWFWVIFHL